MQIFHLSEQFNFHFKMCLQKKQFGRISHHTPHVLVNVNQIEHKEDDVGDKDHKICPTGKAHATIVEASSPTMPFIKIN